MQIAGFLTLSFAFFSSTVMAFREQVSPGSEEQVVLSSIATHEQQSNLRPFVPQDLVRLNRIGQMALSPDNRHVAFSKWKYSIEEDLQEKNLYLLDLETQIVTQLTSEANVKDDEPVWIDSENLVFLRRSKALGPHAHLFHARLSSTGSGKADSVKSLVPTDFHYDISNLKYNAAGGFLSFSAEVFVDDSLTGDLKSTYERDQHLSKQASSAHAFDKLFFRHWDAYDNHKNSHVFILPLDLSKDAVELKFDNAKNLMAGSRDLACPIPPHGDGSQFTFSNDSKELLFASMKDFDKSRQAYSTEIHIYRVSFEGDNVSKPECMSCTEGVGAKTAPSYSPDGKSVAWLQMKEPQFEADKNNLIIVDRESGEKKVLTADWDRSVEQYIWSHDGKKIYLIAQEDGRNKVYSLEIDSGRIDVLFADGSSGNLITRTDADELLFSNSNMKRPAEFFSLYVKTKNVKQLTSFHSGYLSAVDMTAPEEFWFTGALKEKVMGWLLKPANFSPAKKYPLAFLIHGGPQSAWMDAFSTRWNPQVYTGAGYVVVMINFHGSTGYGQKFTDSISTEWGSYPYEDLMKGLDYALQQYRFIDRKRVAALGASYGGYMINWLNGHTDRFRCMVNHDGLFDLKSMYYTTEELYFTEHDFKTPPFKDATLYDKWNPSNHVDKWKTPTLVIHGGKDYRVPQGEGFSTFTALQRQGIESRLLFFPDENHWVLKPANSLRWHKEVLGWINKLTLN